MAKIEEVLLEGKKEKFVNVSYPVGVGMRNEKNDVMLIQVLLNNLHETPFNLWCEPELGLFSKILTVNGILDENTIGEIRLFYASKKESLMSSDDIIHPADYQGKNIEYPLKEMPITLLQVIVKTIMYMYPRRYSEVGKDIVSLIKKEAPDIIFEN